MSMAHEKALDGIAKRLSRFGSILDGVTFDGKNRDDDMLFLRHEGTFGKARNETNLWPGDSMLHLCSRSGPEVASGEPPSIHNYAIGFGTGEALLRPYMIPSQ